MKKQKSKAEFKLVPKIGLPKPLPHVLERPNISKSARVYEREKSTKDQSKVNERDVNNAAFNIERFDSHPEDVDDQESIKTAVFEAVAPSLRDANNDSPNIQAGPLNLILKRDDIN